MDHTPEIVVISKEARIRAELSSLLNALGYDIEVFDEYPSAEVFSASGHFPDLLFFHVDEDNVERAEDVQEVANRHKRTPVLYLTDTKDDAFFSRLKHSKPFGFLTTPLDLGGIRRSIELALLYETGGVVAPPFTGNVSYTAEAVLPTHFFTKVGNKLKKIAIDDVRFVEVEGKYSSIHLEGRKYNVKASLKDLLDKFPATKFVRVSRNFIVNLEYIDHIDTIQYLVKVDDRDIPVSRTYKEELMGRIRLI